MITWLKERIVIFKKLYLLYVCCRTLLQRNRKWACIEVFFFFLREKELILFSILIYGFSCQLTSKLAISRFRLWIKGLSWLGVKWLGSLHKAGPLKCVYAVWTALCVWYSPNERQKENIMKLRYGPRKKISSGWCAHNFTSCIVIFEEGKVYVLGEYC